jgi:hypothetical protein
MRRKCPGQDQGHRLHLGMTDGDAITPVLDQDLEVVIMPSTSNVQRNTPNPGHAAVIITDTVVAMVTATGTVDLVHVVATQLADVIALEVLTAVTDVVVVVHHFPIDGDMLVTVSDQTKADVWVCLALVYTPVSVSYARDLDSMGLLKLFRLFMTTTLASHVALHSFI